MHGICQGCFKKMEICGCRTGFIPEVSAAAVAKPPLRVNDDGTLTPMPGWEGDGGQKFDQDKPRMDLLDSYAIEELAKVLTFGAKKYAPHNWRKGIKLSRLTAAAQRHLLAIMKGEDFDDETKLQHAAHLMCCAMFLVWTIRHRPDMDDRWQQPNRTTNGVEGMKQYLQEKNPHEEN